MKSSLIFGARTGTLDQAGRQEQAGEGVALGMPCPCSVRLWRQARGRGISIYHEHVQPPGKPCDLTKFLIESPNVDIEQARVSRHPVYFVPQFASQLALDFLAEIENEPVNDEFPISLWHRAQ